MNKGNNNFRITALEDNCVVDIVCSKDDTHFPKAEHLYYRIRSASDPTDWIEFDDTIEIELKNEGDFIELYGDTAGFQNMIARAGWTINSDNLHSVGGELASLIDDTNGITDDYEFASFMIDDEGLIDASELILPNNTTKSCYHYLFGGCTNLVYPPKVLPAEIVEDYAYQDMFSYCESLIKIPEMKGKIYKESACSTMFDECYSLTDVTISFETAESGAFNSTFEYCEGLEKASFFCDDISEDPFIWTFYECTNLNTVICTATKFNESEQTKEWLDGVAETGTFYKAKNANWVRGISGIPDGWEVKIYVEPKILSNTYTYAKEIYLQISGDDKDYGSKYMLAKKILDAIENYEVEDHIGKDAKEVGMNLFINGDDRYYTFNGTFTSGDYLIGDIKINGVIPAGNYKGFVINNEIAAILEGSNYNCQAVALKKEGEKYVSK